MLAIGELAEAQEADRNLAVPSEYNVLRAYDMRVAEAEAGGAALWGFLANSLDERKIQIFKWKVKDSVGDELADCYIRLCDFAVGFGEAEMVVMFYDKAPYSYHMPENLGEALFQLTGHIHDSLSRQFAPARIQPDQLAEALRGIEELAERMDIDLFRHIDLKLTYNASRLAKHGKSY